MLKNSKISGPSQGGGGRWVQFELRKLSINDGMDVYEMLQEMPADENGFINPVKGMTFEEFKQWLIERDSFSRVRELIDGWRVPDSLYWLYVDGYPVGFGKLRHFLTEKLRKEGGHIGYAIRPGQRGKGYGTILLKLLIEEARKFGIDRVLLTIKNDNISSIKVALKNNGKIERVSEEKHYIWIDC